MRIVIAGCGKIGLTVLDSLVNENHEVIAIDDDPVVIDDIANAYDVMTVCGNAAAYEKLSEANVKDAELFVASTGSDELNMLSCFLAKRMGAKNTVARIRNKEFNTKNLAFLKQQFEISMVINPELLTAQAIYNVLKLPVASKSETFLRRSFEMVEIAVKPDSVLDGLALSDIKIKNVPQFLVCAVRRNHEVFIPNGTSVIQAGDVVGLIAPPENMHKLLRALGMVQKKTRDIMLLGASRIAFYLAEMLLRSDSKVKIIEKTERRSREICDELNGRATVIHGDGMRHALLEEEGIDTTDAFVALTGMDEENILISYHAITKQVPKVISKINQDGFNDISDKLGLDCIVSPRRITADVIVSYARALKNSLGSKVETLYRLGNGMVEALEFAVSADFSAQNITLKKMELVSGILIAGIIRDQKKIIPGGDDVILPGDRVIVVTTSKGLYDLEDILK